MKDIPVEGITDIAYAFFNLKDSGNGQYVITSGDTYPPVMTILTVDGPISRILSLAKVFPLKIHGNLQNRTWVSSDNSVNFITQRMERSI